MTETKYIGVKTLEGLAGMRAKPAMYLGSTGVLQKGHAPRALTQMAQEVISNSLDEALAGFGKVVKIIVDEDSAMTVIDEGRGLPKGPDKIFDDVIRAATAPHTSGKFDDDSYAGQNTTGTHGIGIKATNAISKKLIIEATCYSTTMKKDAKVLDGGLVQYRIEFEQEKVLSSEEVQRWTKKDLDNMEESERPKTGTKVQFWPDETILESIVWTNNDLEARFEASAFLFPGVEIIYTDNRSDYHKSWKYDDGLASYIKKMTKGEMLLSKLKDPIAIEQLSEVDGYTFKVSAALTYTEDANETIATYANGVPTKEGGPHLDGFYAGLVKAVNDFALDKKLIKQSFRQSDITEGLIAALHVQVPAKIVEFEGQTKEKLATVQSKAATQQVILKSISDWMYDNLDAATQIVEKTEMARQAREAAAKSRKEAKAGKDAKKKKRLEISSKLKQAGSRDRSKCELIITEGDSASNVKRDKMTQAILGIRGKIKNAFELSLAEAVSNQEISTIIGAIGAGVGSDCEPERSNYRAILIGSDADDDGAHIRILLLGLFYRFMRKLIEKGMIYIIVPPLYKAEKYIKGKPEIKMYFTEQELAADRENLQGYSIQRYKGLGEMDKDTEAFDAITNAKTRRVVQVTIEDAMKAAQMLKILLGNDASLRADWIERTIDFEELAYD